MTPSVLAMLPGPVIDGPARGPDPVTDTFAAELDRAVADPPESSPGSSARDVRPDARTERSAETETDDPAVDVDDAAVRGVDDASDDTTAHEVNDSSDSGSDDTADPERGGSDQHASASDDGTGEPADYGDQGDDPSTIPDIAFAARSTSEVVATEDGEALAGVAVTSDPTSMVSDLADASSASPTTKVKVVDGAEVRPQTVADVALAAPSASVVAVDGTSAEGANVLSQIVDVAAISKERVQTSASIAGESVSGEGVGDTAGVAIASGPVIDDEAQGAGSQMPESTSHLDGEQAATETDASTTEPGHTQEAPESNDADSSPELLGQRLAAPRAANGASAQGPAAAGAVDARTAAAPGSAATPTGTSTTGRADQPAMRASIERVMATLDVIAKQPPPRVLTLDLTELHGVRVTLSLDAGSVNVSVADSGAGDAHARQWQDQLDDLLDERNFASDQSAESGADADQTPTTGDRPSTSSDELRI